ncbi:MAG: ABC transporter permease subunit [bacterium]|nr:ABC transporter permease subunit [bacterium]
MIFRYELKKIFQKKTNLIAMLVGYVILLITTVYPVIGETEYLYEQDIEYQGVEAIRFNEDFAKNQTEVLTEDYVTAVLAEIQESNMDPNTDEGYLAFNDSYGNLFNYLVKSYQPIGDDEHRPELLMDVDLTQGAQFYERRVQRVRDFVNQDFSFGNYSEDEKEYWIKKAESVKTPFVWGDTFVLKQYDTVIALAFYLLFVLIICLSGTFSAEHEKGTAGILLSTRHGQRRLVYEKGLAAYIFGFSYVIVGYLISFLWLGVTIGAKGIHLPVQLLDSAICHSMNMGQFLLLQMLISMVVIFFEVTLVLFVSAFTKTTMGTMSLILAGLIIPAFIPFSKGSRLFNHVLALAIVRMVDLKGCLMSFLDYRIGPVILDLPTTTILVHLAATGILLIFLRKAFVKRALRS